MKPLEDLATHCIRCGFCLEDCPTFKITGSELESPRGRIYLARSAEVGTIDWEETREHIDQCLGCLACETACPSGVQYGEILELARARLEERKPHWAKKGLLQVTTNPALMRLAVSASGIFPGRRPPAFVSRMVAGVPAEAAMPEPSYDDWPALDPVGLPPVKGQVFLLEGCAMRVLFPGVHSATRRLLRRVGFEVREAEQGCCGALHAHAGYLDHAANLARDLARSFSKEIPVVVNSAGCGSTMKRYKDLAPDDEAVASLADRTLDASVFLHNEGLSHLLERAAGFDGLTVTYHDACHLAHGQGVRLEPRELLDSIPGLELVQLTESDTCCGSAGTYNFTQPEMARKLLDRKLDRIEATGASVAVTGNPGCHAWIAQGLKERGGQVRMLHTLELLEAAFSGLPA